MIVFVTLKQKPVIMKQVKKFAGFFGCIMFVVLISLCSCNNKSKKSEAGVPSTDTLKKAPEIKDTERLEPMSTRPVKTPN
jgi:hypothetical protein